MTVPEAIETAKKHLASVLPEFSDGVVELEELETPPNASKWTFTFSASRSFSLDKKATLADILRSRRVTKTIELDSTDGSMLSIRNIAE